MITVWISGEQHEGIDAGWIVRTIEGKRREGQAVCVRVTLRSAGIDVQITAGSCPAGAGGRAPNASEKNIIDLWNECGVADDRDFNPRVLVRCLEPIASRL